VTGRERLPRGGRVDLELSRTEKGWSGLDVRLLETTDAEVDALLSGSAMAIDAAFAPIDPPAPPPAPASQAPAPPPAPPRPVTP